MQNPILPGSYHFTYEHSTGSNLLQGDVLEKTELLSDILRKSHPCYLEESYTHFLVISQSCDLVRERNPPRGLPCKARYITLAAVRPLSLLLGRLIEASRSTELSRKANVCSESRKGKVREELERLLNNNNHDYFYLHSDPTLKFLLAAV